MKYLIAITLSSMQLIVAPLSAFHYGPEPVESFQSEGFNEDSFSQPFTEF